VQRPRTPLPLVAAVCLSAPALAAPGDPVHRVLPDPGYEGLQFGEDVDIKGDLAIVSGLGVFTTPIDGGAWIVDAPTGELLSTFPQPTDPGTGEPISSRFYGVAISRPVALPAGHTAPVALVGTVQSPPCSCYRPLLRAFDLADPTGPVLIWQATPEGAVIDDDFANSIAIDGSVAIVGAAGDRELGPLAGAAYLFDITTGEQLSKLLADDGGDLDQFGYDVDLDGGLAIIGARWQTDSVGRSGAAYVFDVSDPSNPTQLARLKHDDEDVNDYFGFDVAVQATPTGAIAAVGSIFDDDLGLDAGATYLYDLTDPANPTLAIKLLAEDGRNNRRLRLVGRSRPRRRGTGHRAHRRAHRRRRGPRQRRGLLLRRDRPRLPPAAHRDAARPGQRASTPTAGPSRSTATPRSSARRTTTNIAANSGRRVYILDASRGPGACNDADLAEPFGVLDLADITSFIAAFGAGDPAADLDGSGLLDLADINLFVSAFLAGCP
jgi:hypothetical protein